ncbi:hypothetical protein [Cohnella nanjingensis]|uniref:hypothetical protein n=1 Tax=Cohnella nanjingensis TaxID=1387779 RepID=UPI001FE4A0C3|nr:hypothetical protein [Cohnella nanjingensis]
MLHQQKKEQQGAGSEAKAKNLAVERIDFELPGERSHDRDDENLQRFVLEQGLHSQSNL